MKKLLTVGIFVATALASTANAATYSLLNDGMGSSALNGTNPRIAVSNWHSTLTVNDTGASTLTGSFTSNYNKVYSVNISLTDKYTNAMGFTAWGTTVGTVTGGGVTYRIYDSSTARDMMDSVLGVNAAPYNNHVGGANDKRLEFGLWGFNAPVHGVHNFDVNVHVACTSSAPTANGACGPTGNVPLPGTLALTGLALLGLGLRKKLTK